MTTKKTKVPKRRATAARRPAGRVGNRPWATMIAAAIAILFVAGLAVGGRLGNGGGPMPAPITATADRPEPPLPERVPDRIAASFVTTAAAVAPPATPHRPEPPVKPAALPREPAPAAEAAPERTESREPAWERNAVPADPPPNRPMIAIVIDDLGVNQAGTRDTIALPGPLTLAFMTYADDLAAQTAAAKAAGHELLVHFPMEPSVPDADPGPNALLRSLDPAEIKRRLDWGLARFDGYVGVNNHMGSAFTEDADAMAVVLDELARRGLLFLDSRTTPRTAAPKVAESIGLPFSQRDVFLDNEQSKAAVAAQLATLEAKARDKGAAIGIGHPHPATVAALRAWLPGLAARGFTLVPVSAVLRAQQDRPAVASGG